MFDVSLSGLTDSYSPSTTRDQFARPPRAVLPPSIEELYPESPTRRPRRDENEAELVSAPPEYYDIHNMSRMRSMSPKGSRKTFVPPSGPDLFQNELQAEIVAETAKRERVFRDIKHTNNRMADVLERNDSKILSAVNEIKRLRRELEKSQSDLAGSRRTLESVAAERASWQKQIELSRLTIRKFEVKLNQTRLAQENAHINRQAQSELEALREAHERLLAESEILKNEAMKSKGETAILTRALALHGQDTGASAENLLDAGRALMDNDALRGEMEKLMDEREQMESRLRKLEPFPAENERLRAEIAELGVIANDRERIQLESATVQSELGLTTEQLRSAQSELRELKERLATAEVDAMRSRKETNRRVGEAETIAEQAIDEMHRIRSEMESIENELDSVRNQLAAEKEGRVEEEDQRVELSSELAACRSTIAQLESRVGDLSASLEAEHCACENVTDRLRRLQLSLDVKTSELESARREAHIAKSKLSEAKTQATQFESEATRNLDKFSIASTKIALLTTDLQKREARIADMTAARESLKRSLTDQIQSLQSQVEALSLAKTAAETKVATLNRDAVRMRSVMTSETVERLSRTLKDSSFSSSH